jgi:site-specific recombinase XerD
MDNPTLLGPWVRRFLLDYMVGERNLARNTQRSYRDTLILLLPFVATQQQTDIDRLTVEQVAPDLIRRFLQDLETTRRCSIATRNQRLAAIHALARFISAHSPEHVAWCGMIRGISFKKAPQPVIAYLEKDEMDALLAAPDQTTAQGQRDYAVLLFLYNTGARASEATNVAVADLELTHTPSVKLWGKGDKSRYCPLWPITVHTLVALIGDREPTERVFLNRCQRPLTRFGLHTLVERYAHKAAMQMPSLAAKRVSPHSIRHTTAVHLLRAGVDINTIRAWLGHVSLETTNIYAQVDLEMKSKALSLCEVDASQSSGAHWLEDKSVMAFLATL